MSVLRLDEVDYYYRPDTPVLTAVSLEMPPGQSALVLGDNGSGKSTLGRLIGGLIRPSSGTITVDGTVLSKTPSRARAGKAIYVSQISYLQFFRATLSEVIALAVAQSGQESPTDGSLEPFSLPSLDTNPRDLTYPEMWRFQLLLLGSIFRPSVLYIDEVVAPGASAQQMALRQVLRQRRHEGRVTLLAYQRFLDVGFDRVFTVARGAVSEAGTPSG